MTNEETSFIINELGEDRENYFNAVAPPIIQTSNFSFKKVEELHKAFKDEYSTFLYSRGLNPTVSILTKKLAALDNAEDCLAFNSGAAAIFSAVMGNVKSGDHIISVRKPYSWAQHLFNKILPRYGISTSYVDGRDVKNFEEAITPATRIIYLETPNSWTFDLQDLTAVSAIAKQHGILTICDNSYCTPLYQRPIEYGIDLTLQSATKYIGGHSDVVAGVLSGKRNMIEKIFNNEFNTAGNGISPFNAWLLLRGLRTLPARLERITSTTNTVINFLQDHPAVEQILFPFHSSFTQLDLAKKQMSGACGLFSLVLNINTYEQAVTFAESLRHILMAVSWGGHESLVIPGCAAIDPQDFDKNNIDHRMVRLYIGLEDADYLISDLGQALGKIT